MLIHLKILKQLCVNVGYKTKKTVITVTHVYLLNLLPSLKNHIPNIVTDININKIGTNAISSTLKNATLSNISAARVFNIKQSNDKNIPDA